MYITIINCTKQNLKDSLEISCNIILTYKKIKIWKKTKCKATQDSKQTFRSECCKPTDHNQNVNVNVNVGINKQTDYLGILKPHLKPM